MAEYRCQAPECPRDGKPFTAKRVAKFCSPTCRKRANRQGGPPVEPAPESVPDPPLVVRVTASLQAVGKLETWEGEMAVAAARKIAAASTTAAQTGSLMDKLTALMDRLTKTATPAADGRRPGVRGRWRAKIAEGDGTAA